MTAHLHQHDNPDLVDAAPPCSAGRGKVWLLAALFAAAVYLPTMAPGILWGDSGDAQIRVLRGEFQDPNPKLLARSHVTYFAVAIAFRDALGLEPALAANLVAAFAGIITVANFGWLISLFVRRRTPIVCGVAMLLLSHTFWQLSTGAEVVTFSTMCLSLELVLFVRFIQTRSFRWLALAALANGIGWSTHNFALLIWPAYALLAVMRWNMIPKPRARSLALVAGMWGLGSLPLIVLTILHYRHGGDASVTIRSLLIGWYGKMVFNTSITPGLVLKQVAFVAYNFPTPLILLAVIGWWRLRVSQGRAMWSFLTVAALVYFGFAARYRVPDQYTFLVHGYVFLVLFAAVGIDHWLVRFPSKAMRSAVVLLSLIAPLAYFFAPPLIQRIGAGSFPVSKRSIPYRDSLRWFLTPWRTGYDGAERFARETLDMLPPDAVLLADSTIRRPLDYLMESEDLRNDVHIPDFNLKLDAPDDPEGSFTVMDSHIQDSRLFSAGNIALYAPKWLVDAGYQFIPAGHVYKVELPPSTSKQPARQEKQ